MTEATTTETSMVQNSSQKTKRKLLIPTRFKSQKQNTLPADLLNSKYMDEL